MAIKYKQTLIYLIILTLWGISAFLPKLAVRTISTPTAVAAEVTGGIVLVFILLIIKSFTSREVSSNRITGSWLKGGAAAIAGGTIGYTGIFTYIASVKELDIHIAAMVSGLYPAITVLLSVTFLRERLTWNHWLGLVFTLAAIVLISGG